MFIAITLNSFLDRLPISTSLGFSAVFFFFFFLFLYLENILNLLLGATESHGWLTWSLGAYVGLLLGGAIAQEVPGLVLAYCCVRLVLGLVLKPWCAGQGPGGPLVDRARSWGSSWAQGVLGQQGLLMDRAVSLPCWFLGWGIPGLVLTGWQVALATGTNKLGGRFQNGTCKHQCRCGRKSSPNSCHQCLCSQDKLQDEQVGLTQAPFKSLLYPSS